MTDEPKAEENQEEAKPEEEAEVKQEPQGEGEPAEKKEEAPPEDKSGLKKKPKDPRAAELHKALQEVGAWENDALKLIGATPSGSSTLSRSVMTLAAKFREAALLRIVGRLGGEERWPSEKRRSSVSGTVARRPLIQRRGGETGS